MVTATIQFQTQNKHKIIEFALMREVGKSIIHVENY